MKAFQQHIPKNHEPNPTTLTNNFSTQINSNPQRMLFSRRLTTINLPDFYNEEKAKKQQFQELKSQVTNFHEAQKQFMESPITQNDFVYLVSLNWLSKWKQLVHFNEIVSNQNFYPSSLPNFEHLGVMNSQLVDRNGMCTVQLHDHGNQCLSECLKKDLICGRDYKFISMTAWSFLRRYSSIPILRKVHKESGSVEVYLLHAHLFIISHKIIRQLRQHKRKSIPFQTVQISKYGSSTIFSLNLKHIINTLLESKYKVSEKYDPNEQYDVRFIRSTSSLYSLDKIRFRVQNSYLSQCKSDTFTVRIPQTFQHLDETPLDIPRQAESIILICEVFKTKTRKLSEQPRIIYTKQIDSICPKCKKMTQLTKICFCQHIVYCSSNCQMTDVQHLKTCFYRKRRIKKDVNKIMLKNNNNLVGLYNQHNDCYMNASIQCLYRIHELTDYFIHQRYLGDMVNQLPKQSLDIYSTFTSLFTNLNRTQKRYVSAAQFKRAFQKKYPHFSGNNQHDAVQFLQELLSFFYDSLRQKMGKIKQVKEQEEKNYRIMGQSAWNQFTRENNQQLTNMFGGQERNTYKCPKCSYESNSFSIFNPIFLCIPSEKWRMFVLHNHRGSTIQKLKLFYKKNQSLNEMIQRLRQDERIPQSSELLVYSQSTELSVTKQKTPQEVSSYLKEDIHVRVLSKMEQVNGYRVLVKLTQDLGIGKIKYPQFSKMFKFSKDKCLYEILNHIYECYRDIFDVGSFIYEAKQKTHNRNIRIITEPSQDSPCQVCRSDCSGCQVPYSQLKVGRFFSKQFYCYKFIYMIRTEKTIIPQMQEKIDRSFSLTDCLRYQYMENLVDVKCSKCSSNIQVYQKTYLMKTPQILILSIKRIAEDFKKNEEVIRFPIQNLNLLPFCDLSVLRSNSMEQSECYDLFAMCSHAGNTQNGHYTATCKVLTNENEWKWYRFNDQRVCQVKNINEIVSGDAYILFYRKK